MMERRLSKISIQTESANYCTIVSNYFIDNYMPNAHGDYVKVYVYVIRLLANNISDFDTKKAAHDLLITESDVLKALHYWNSLDLINVNIDEISEVSKPISFNSSKQRKELSTITTMSKNPTQDSLSKYLEDKKFNMLTKIAGKYFKRPITVSELKIIVTLLEKYNLDYDTIEFLIEYITDNNYKSFRTLKTKAQLLHENGITDYEEAVKYIKSNDKKYISILKAFGFDPETRGITSDEVKLVDKWIKQYKMPLKLIIYACKRTTGYVKENQFKYCHSIITNWHNKGIKTVEDAKTEKVKKGKTSNTKTISRKKYTPLHQHDYHFNETEEDNIRQLEERMKKFYE